MAISPVPPFSGTPPNRSQPQATFNTNVANWVSYTTTIQTDLNTFATEANALAAEANGYQALALSYKNEAEASASAALTSQNLAAASADFKGAWLGLTGALNKPATVSHNGSFWALLNNLANVASSEPSLTNTDWQFISGTRWQEPFTTSGALPRNAMCQIIATTEAVDRQLQAGMAVGDFAVAANSQNSTQTVRITNNGYTIYGGGVTVSPSDNITVLPGDSISLRCTAENTLEIY